MDPADVAFGSIAPTTWVEPIGGTCPVTHPIKANDRSRIYHEPGTPFYDRTVPERCYATTAAAEDDGYRAPKRGLAPPSTQPSNPPQPDDGGRR